jgi:hypothetical protein
MRSLDPRTAVATAVSSHCTHRIHRYHEARLSVRRTRVREVSC